MTNSNAKFIFTSGNSAIRACDINISNSSMIKHLSFIGRVNFASKVGGMYAGYYAHTNNLSKPIVPADKPATFAAALNPDCRIVIALPQGVMYIKI